MHHDYKEVQDRVYDLEAELEARYKQQYSLRERYVELEEELYEQIGYNLDLEARNRELVEENKFLISNVDFLQGKNLDLFKEILELEKKLKDKGNVDIQQPGGFTVRDTTGITYPDSDNNPFV